MWNNEWIRNEYEMNNEWITANDKNKKNRKFSSIFFLIHKLITNIPVIELEFNAIYLSIPLVTQHHKIFCLE